MSLLTLVEQEVGQRGNHSGKKRHMVKNTVIATSYICTNISTKHVCIFWS